MRRVVSLYLPRWPSDRWRRSLGRDAPPAEVPTVVVGRQGARKLVLDADAAALQLGVTPGLVLAQAQARVPGLTIVEADPAADAAALDRLALWGLGRYSPLVAVDGADGLWIEVTGAAHLFGGEAALLDDLVGRLVAAGVHGRAAMASTPGAAHALTRFGADQRVSSGSEEAADLSRLPLAALRLAPEMVAALGKLGFETIGDLEQTPRAPLALRFGPELTRRLDQAFGRVFESFEPLQPSELVRVRHTWFEPIGAPETIARRTGKLVFALCSALEAKGLGARRLDLICERVDGRLEAVRIGTAKPNRDAKRLTRLLCDRLDTVDPGFGIEAMSLSASSAEPLAPRQTPSSLAGEVAPVDVEGLVDVLANRLGRSKVYRMTPMESDVPERCVRRVSPTSAATGRSWPARWPRPSRLLSPPERVDTIAALPDQPPVSFTWRGQRRRVKRADGPERIFGEWWKRDAELDSVRDYFAVEDEAGERFWLYRQGDGEIAATGDLRWFIHGVFA